MNDGQDALAPFYRRGKSRPLTANDYATITGTTNRRAVNILSDLIRSGDVVSSRISKNHLMIYEVQQ